MKNFRLIVWSVLAVLVSCGNLRAADELKTALDGKVVVAYVTSWSHVIPDPKYMTHINYAFGHVDETFDGVGIANEGRLRQMVELKKQKPDLNVLLSIGGWGSGRFSEMAANEKYRKAFAKDCRRVVKEYGLDGIDIDWEYPTSSMPPAFLLLLTTRRTLHLLMRDIRKLPSATKKLLTLATVASGRIY